MLVDNTRKVAELPDNASPIKFSIIEDSCPDISGSRQPAAVCGRRLVREFLRHSRFPFRQLHIHLLPANVPLYSHSLYQQILYQISKFSIAANVFPSSSLVTYFVSFTTAAQPYHTDFSCLGSGICLLIMWYAGALVFRFSFSANE